MLGERGRVLVLWVQITTHNNIRAQIWRCGWVSQVRGNGRIDHVHGVQGLPTQGGHRRFNMRVLACCQSKHQGIVAQ
jgi:hypothetical protein